MPRQIKTSDAAIAGARQHAAGRAGVAAYSIVTDPEVDFTGEPQVLFRPANCQANWASATFSPPR